MQRRHELVTALGVVWLHKGRSTLFVFRVFCGPFWAEDPEADRQAEQQAAHVVIALHHDLKNKEASAWLTQKSLSGNL